MKKFINSPDAFPDDSLNGLVAAHGDIIVMDPSRKFIRRKTLTPGKVALISGGGSGHEPMHVGFVGQGMLDAACPGRIFTFRHPTRSWLPLMTSIRARAPSSSSRTMKAT